MSDFPKCVSCDSLLELDRKTNLQTLRNKSKIRFPKKTIPKAPRKMTYDEAIHHELWVSHRQRVRDVTCEVENQAPDYPWARRTGVSGLYANAVQFMERTKKKIQTLTEVSKIIRTHGVINPFRYERVYTMSCLPLSIKNLERIEQENLDIGKRILDVVSEVDTGLRPKDKKLPPTPQPKKSRRRSSNPSSLKDRTLAKYRGYNILLPRSNLERRQLLRPHIFFDVSVKDERPLGRVVIELYTEAAPLVVLKLVKACKANKHNNFVIKRLFPDLWMDVEMPLPPHSELQRPLEYDAKVIDHGAPGCVLSFRRDCLSGFRSKLSFSISFRALRVANDCRIGFGRVIEGSKIVDCLQSYGTKNGKLWSSIVFNDCGCL